VLVSCVVRLVAGALAEGEIVGQAQEVESGDRAVIRCADDLVSFLLRQAPTATDTPAT
jgi:hypothetical protein